MGKVRNRTQAALHEFVSESLDEERLKQQLRRVERTTSGANPHNVGMATFEFTNRGVIDEKTEQEIKQVLSDTFPDHQLPGTFPENWDGE